MSLAKATLEDLKDHECKRTTLCKSPPIPYFPKKNSVQEMVSSLKAESLKTQIGKGTELQVSIRHFRTCKAFLMHVESAMDVIKKRGHFKAHKKANNAYVERNLVKQAKAALAELDKTTSEGAETSRRSSKKHKEAAAKADAPKPDLQAMYQLDLGRPEKLQRTPGPRQNQLLRTCSSSMQTCCL
jgi:hypothetical protein